MQRTPKIRFAGFMDDWEQRRFEEFVKSVAKKNRENLELEPYAVTNDRGFIAQKDAHDDFGYMNNVDRTAYNIVPPNSFAYNPARINVGSLGYYAGSKNVIVSSLYEVFQTEEYIDDRFLWHWLKSSHFPKWIEKLQEGSVRLYFYFDKLVQCQMLIPSYEEQRKVSAYLDNLDNLINLYQRKCDILKKIKKFMLQTMFPKKGELKPEIRFAGFTNDWEQRKLGDICERVTRKNKKEESDLPLTIASQYGLIDQREFFNKVVAAKDMSNYYLLKKGEFAYNKSYSNGYDYGSIKRLNSYKQGCLSTLYICFKIISNDIESDYLECYFDTLKWYKDVSLICSEGARNHGLLNVDTKAFFDDVYIEIPMCKEEQKKISEYLNNLDHFITLHQRKCKELKQMKKFMLQNMFI